MIALLPANGLNAATLSLKMNEHRAGNGQPVQSLLTELPPNLTDFAVNF
jgi:hypothetical protein